MYVYVTRPHSRLVMLKPIIQAIYTPVAHTFQWANLSSGGCGAYTSVEGYACSTLKIWAIGIFSLCHWQIPEKLVNSQPFSWDRNLPTLHLLIL